MLENPESDAGYDARREALLRVSIKSPDKLKEWLEASGRRYLIFDAFQLVDALPWPHGLDALAQVIACYRDHRRTVPSGRFEKVIDARGESRAVPQMRGETLEADEQARLIKYLIRQVQELDPTWSLSQMV
jgi:hypothetical protein